MKQKIKALICTLAFIAVSGAMNAQTSFRILNYNMRMSGQMVNYNAKPFADFIKQHNPDFVVVQEVDYKTVRNGQKDFLTELAAELGMFSAFGAAIEYQQGEYGVGILSKYPLEKIVNNALTSNRSELKEKRTVLYVDVTIPTTGQKIRVGVTHLDHSTDQVRLDMVTQLNSYINSSTPTILGGDFNAYVTESAIQTMISSWQKICDNFPTYSASNPTSKIDYIFARPMNKWTVKNFQRVANTTLSDHLALIADVEFNP